MKKPGIKLDVRKKIILVSAIISLALIVAAVFVTADAAIIGNVIIISLLVLIVPYFVYRYSEFTRIKAIERQFPNFVRDLAESKRSGISLTEAIKLSSRANYGKLTPEVVRMSNRLSWGTPFLRTLNIFGESVKQSKIIHEALNIIKQSYKSGGNIAATLDSVAKDIRNLKEAEDERKSLTKQHVLIMYGIFFIFVGVAIAIIYVMVPMLQSQPEATTGLLAFRFVNPCPQDALQGPFIFPCGLFAGIAATFSVPYGIASYYVALFFSVLIIQGIFSGLIAGQLGENSVVAGTKHSIIMVTSAIVIFLFLAKTGFLPK